MSDLQMWLLEPAAPLRERLGLAFFRGVPERPGVYFLMGKRPGDREERLLYVGKAGNLRHRLASYRGVRAGRAARKTVRLVHCVERITWEVCASETDARLRENALLRSLRPVFNRANVWPAGYWFVAGCASAAGWTIRLSHDRPEADWCYGAFKGSQGFAALGRLWWAVSHGDRQPVVPPGRLFGKHFLRGLEVGTGAPPGADGVDWPGWMAAYWSGASDELVNRMDAALAGRGGSSLFESAWQSADLETARQFFRHGPRRNRELRSHFGRTRSWLGAEELDDLMVRSSLGVAGEPSPNRFGHCPLELWQPTSGGSDVSWHETLEPPDVGCYGREGA